MILSQIIPQTNTFGTPYSKSQTSPFKIYLITQDNMKSFSKEINHGVSTMSSLTSTDYIWSAPKTIDVTEQIDLINAALADGANAIILDAIDPIKEASVIEYAKSLSCIVTYVNNASSEDGLITLATNNSKAGFDAASFLITQLHDLGITTGEIGIINASAVDPNVFARIVGFQQALKAKSEFEIILSEPTNNSTYLAKQYTHALLTDTITPVGLFAVSFENTLGMGTALQETNTSIPSIGLGYSEEIINFLSNGYLYATLIQNPFTMGYLGMAQTIAALKGYSTGPNFIDTGTSLVTNTTIFRK